jgi:predicted metal-binding protein
VSSPGANKIDKRIDELIQKALRLGASATSVISASDISVEDKLAELCRKPQCESFGLSPSCPPHVSGPDGFRDLLKDFNKALVVKIDVPASVLFSDERRGVMQLLHEIVAGVERSAIEMRFVHSKAFAGGSCKQIFCCGHIDCRVLREGGECRNPHSARPSMSGFGINVIRLMRAAGFNADNNIMDGQSNGHSMSWVSGLVLIG